MSTKRWQELRDQDATFHLKKRFSPLKPLTSGQNVYLNALRTHTVTLAHGPAGTGKTYLAIGIAVEMLRQGVVSRLVLIRPQVTCGPGIGFLPGDLGEKIAPHMRPFLDAMHDFCTSDELAKWLRDKVVEFEPPDYLRGASLKNCLLVIDEAQNLEYGQAHMLLTRFAAGGRVVMTGDVSQTDLPCEQNLNPFRAVVRRLRHVEGVAIVVLTRADIVRHPLTRAIDEALARHVVPDVMENHAWYRLECPACHAGVWYDNGDEADFAVEDVGLVSCWNCEKLLVVPDLLGGKVVVTEAGGEYVIGRQSPED